MKRLIATSRISILGRCFLASVPFVFVLSGCDGAEESGSGQTTVSAGIPINRVVDVDGERGLYLRCSGSGSPTLVMEGGDEDTSDSYAFAESRLAAVTRPCVYDRANLGGSDPAPGPRGYADLVDDLERLLAKAEVPDPYVLVATSGGGYISAGYAFAHPEQIAGIAFIEVPAPSVTHRNRLWRKRSGITPRTSSDATTSRWKRTPGQTANKWGTSQ